MTTVEQHTPMNTASTTEPTIPEFFAPERWFQTESLEEARDACETAFCYERTATAIDQIFLEQDLRLLCSGERYRLTGKAFADLCHILQIPEKFAHEIPTDLISIIVERLKCYHEQTAIVIHHDDVVVGIIDPQKWTRTRAITHRPHYLPVPATQLLPLLENLWNDGNIFWRMTLTDSGLQAEVVNPEVSLEPRVGDLTRVGVVITSSETGGPMPQARGYTLRLVCANGATVPAQLGRVVRFSTDWRMRPERRLEVFAEELHSLTVDVETLRQTYARLVAEPVIDHDFYNLYRQARYLYRSAARGEQCADHALGVDAEQRRQIVGRVRQRQNDLRRMVSSPPSAFQPTDLLAWDVFNSLTEAGRRERVFQRRVALERLAGDVLQVYLPRAA